jgi:dihydrofolate reductase
MAPRYRFHGHAIVSDDDMIADAKGDMPLALVNAADWSRFQRELDKAVAVVLGSKGHRAHRNVHNRNRIVVSSSARGVDKRDDAWWWNPAAASIEEVLAAAAPHGGIVAVPGGQAVFDLFLEIGYDEFHLVRARGVKIGDGIHIFSECKTGRSAEEVLAERGLVPTPSDALDPSAGVIVTTWHKGRAID